MQYRPRAFHSGRRAAAKSVSFSANVLPRRRDRRRRTDGRAAGGRAPIRSISAITTREWGRPVGDDRRLFEKLCLEGFQSGPLLADHPAEAREFPRSLRRLRFREGGEVRRARRRSAASPMPASSAIAARSSRSINNAKPRAGAVAEAGSLAAFVWRYEPDPKSAPEADRSGAAIAADARRNRSRSRRS